MKNPYLIQTAQIKNKIKKQNHGTIDETLFFSYMGSAEFEFGALPKSLKRILKDVSNYQIFETEFNDIIGRPFWFIGTKEQFEEYKEYIPQLLNDKIRLKEWNWFPQLYNPRSPWKNKSREEWYDKPNIGWDIENDVLMCFTSKKYAVGIIEALNNTYKKFKEDGRI